MDDGRLEGDLTADYADFADGEDAAGGGVGRCTRGRVRSPDASTERRGYSGQSEQLRCRSVLTSRCRLRRGYSESLRERAARQEASARQTTGTKGTTVAQGRGRNDWGAHTPSRAVCGAPAANSFPGIRSARAPNGAREGACAPRSFRPATRATRLQGESDPPSPRLRRTGKEITCAVG